MNWKRLITLATACALFLLFFLGLGMRRVVLEAQYRMLGSDFPFTLESALHYRRVKMLYDTGVMPRVDKGVQYPEGIDVRRTYEFGSERVQAMLAHGLPGSFSVGDRLRWVESSWFCLGIPFMALWIFWRTGNRLAGVVAGGFYAVMISSVIRSTGQELSKENFALPLLLAHLAFSAKAERDASIVWSWIAAAFLGWSLWNWDLIQYYVLLWAIFTAWKAIRGVERPALLQWLPTTLVLVVVGAVSPYYRAHGFLLSPAMLLLFGHTAACLVGRPSSVLLHIAPLGIAPFATTLSEYGESYHHFTGLLWAKIRYLNHKPADPALLSFENRIMWVPALNSATLPLTIRLFPAMLITSLVAAVTTFRSRQHPGTGQLNFYYVVSLFAFCFFVRFHVFLALFMAALAGILAARAANARLLGRTAAIVLLSASFVVEASNTCLRPERWGRGNIYYSELKELNNWLRQHAAPDAVLANFGTSGAIGAYGKCPIILHPKFESRAIRDRIRQYGELLFKGSELDFRNWADALGADYFVYAKGEFSSQSPELQMRYFVDALDPATNAPARLFEFKPDALEFFRPVWSDAKYSVFKILTRADEVAAGQHGRAARKALQQGDLAAAEREAIDALRRNPRDVEAADVMRLVGELRTQGFRQGAHDQN